MFGNFFIIRALTKYHTKRHFVNFMKINFVTSNKNKIREFKKILEPDIIVNPIEMEYPELRSDDSQKIAQMSASMLSRELKKTIVVEDSGLFINALRGFPGTCSSYIHKRIGLHGILKLMEGIDDRVCAYRSAVAYCEVDSEPVSFLGEEIGKISHCIRGIFGFGHDPIFVPQGSEKTYGEMENCDEAKKFRRIAAMKLRDFLLN